MSEEANLTLIRTNLRRYTFDSKKIKNWVESRSSGYTLNLFAGKNKLDVNEVRNDLDGDAEYNMDAFDFVNSWGGDLFDTVIIDPPYSYRKAMEMYDGNYSSRFKLIADNIPKITTNKAKIISFGYHSTFMGNKRGYKLDEMCIFAHGGAQHCTIAIVEKKVE